MALEGEPGGAAGPKEAVVLLGLWSEEGVSIETCGVISAMANLGAGGAGIPVLMEESVEGEESVVLGVDSMEPPRSSLW